MKTAFSLATLAYAANAVAEDKCDKKEAKLERWSLMAEKRITRTERRFDKAIESYTERFNCDDSNPDRVDDITEDELSMFMMDVIAAAVDNGDFPASNLWNRRNLKIGECDLDEAVMEFEGLRDVAQEAVECLKYLKSDEGMVAPDVAAYFSCDNAVFADSEWCMEEEE